MQMKKAKTWNNWLNKFGIFLPLVLVGAIFIFSNQSPAANNTEKNVTCSEIHWHALLEIEINGEKQFIPANVGIDNGIVIDTELSGANAAPIHTHDNDGVLHIENICPDKKPETTTLGYFFKVWQKDFNSTCILDKCNYGEKIVQMSVNGANSIEFDEYKLQDGDEIVIKYGRQGEPSHPLILKSYSAQYE